MQNQRQADLWKILQSMVRFRLVLTSNGSLGCAVDKIFLHFFWFSFIPRSRQVRIVGAFPLDHARLFLLRIFHGIALDVSYIYFFLVIFLRVPSDNYEIMHSLWAYWLVEHKETAKRLNMHGFFFCGLFWRNPRALTDCSHTSLRFLVIIRDLSIRVQITYCYFKTISFSTYRGCDTHWFCKWFCKAANTGSRLIYYYSYCYLQHRIHCSYWGEFKRFWEVSGRFSQTTRNFFLGFFFCINILKCYVQCYGLGFRRKSASTIRF